MSVDTRTSGRTLHGYKRHRIDADTVVLVDPDLARLPVEVFLTPKGLLGHKLRVDVDGLDGAPCPINLVR